MERKIGEIFEYNGGWYQCITGYSCWNCAFKNDNYEERERITLKNKLTKEETTGLCTCKLRNDKKSVIFKKLEKVGLPYYNSDNKLCQEYKCYIVPLITDDIVYVLADNRAIIEVKQNKEEDMEEKKIQLKQEDIDYLTRKIRYLVYKTNDYDRATEEIMNLFIPSDTEHSSSEKIGKNLKPFDLEAAKAGKPVCTRDGRKARIICFDSNGSRPIVALVTECDDEEEIPYKYHCDGSYNCQSIPSDKDLMMLPEKKEGWINVYALNTCYSSKEEAEANIDRDYEDKYVRTVKINWEE